MQIMESLNHKIYDLNPKILFNGSYSFIKFSDKYVPTQSSYGIEGSIGAQKRINKGIKRISRKNKKLKLKNG